MSDADTLRRIAENIEAQEDLSDELEQLQQDCRWLRRENEYLRDWMASLGFYPDDHFSVADVIAIEKALATVKP